MSPLALVATGFLLGSLSGLFGVGGSSIATPVLRLLAVPRLTALGTPLPVTLPTALVGGWTYWRRGLVNTRAVLYTAAGGVPAVVIGSYLTARVPGRALMLLTGVFVLAVGARLLVGPLVVQAERAETPPRRRAYLAVGAGVGLLSGLLANGGGFLLVPAYLMLFQFEPQEAAASSLVAVALLGLPGSYVHWRLGHVDWRLAFFLTLGVVPATWLSSQWATRIRADRFRLLFGSFLLIFGVLFLTRTVYRVALLGWWG